MNPRPGATLEHEGSAPPHLDPALRAPRLPDPAQLRDRRLIAIFDGHARVGPGQQALEAGCGDSPWIAFLARERRCVVTGLEIDPTAAARAEAILSGCGVHGEILARDAFDVSRNGDLLSRFDLVYSMGVLEHLANPVDGLLALAAYLRPGGRVLTTVPNLGGWNGFVQYLGSVDELEMHELYDLPRLAWVHECAGFRMLASGYVGFFDGHLSSAARAPQGTRRTLHRFVCDATGGAAEMWARATHGRLAPETSLLSPHLFYVGTV